MEMNAKNKQLADEFISKYANEEKLRFHTQEIYKKEIGRFKQLSTAEKTKRLRFLLYSVEVYTLEGMHCPRVLIDKVFSLSAILQNVECFVFKEQVKNGNE